MKKKSLNLSVPIDEELDKAIEQMVRITKLKRADVVRHLLRKQLGQHRTDPRLTA